MRRKLDADQVAEIRRAWAGGATAPDLARRFGITGPYVWKLCEAGAFETRAGRARAAAAVEAGRLASRKREAAAARSAATRARDDEIRRLWSAGWPGVDLAAKFGLSRPSVSAIVAGLPRARRYGGPEDDAPAAPLPRALAPTEPDREAPAPAPARPPGPGDRLAPEGPLRGSANGRSKLDEPGVAEMRRLRAAGWSTGDLAARFGVGRNTVCYAVNGETWKHVPMIGGGP